VVGIRQIDVGNIISPSNTNGLVVVTQLHPISLIFTLPETSLPQIQQQQQKTKTPLKVLAYNQDNTMKLDEGELGLVNNEILQTTGSIQLKANFDNKGTSSGRASSSTRGCSSMSGITASPFPPRLCSKVQKGPTLTSSILTTPWQSAQSRLRKSAMARR
jgi:hypothetical protein